MKKLLLIILFSLSVFISSSQSRLGYTESQIRQDFSNKKFQTSYTESGTKYIYFDDGEIVGMYFFDENGYCNLCSAFPLSTGVLNYMVERFNKEYVIVDDTKWKYYTGGNVIIYIQLVEVSGKMTFIFMSKN